MVASLEIGTCAAEAGEKATGRLLVGERPGGGGISLPIMVANGAQEGPCVWLNGAIHGDEPEGPLSIFGVFDTLDPTEMKGTVVGVPALNPLAFEAAERGNPFDTFSYDMNRNYPGSDSGFLSDRIAHAHFNAMKAHADYEVSIHSGGSHSYLAQAVIFGPNDKSLELAKSLGPGWDLLLRSFSTQGSPMAEMVQLDRAGVTLELGGLCDTRPDRFRANAKTLSDAMTNILKHLDVIPGQAQYEQNVSIGSAEVVGVNRGGLWVPLKGLPLREPVDEGTILAHVRSLEGEILEEVRAPTDCVIFGIRTRPQIFAGEWAVFYSVIEEGAGT